MINVNDYKISKFGAPPITEMNRVNNKQKKSCLPSPSLDTFPSFLSEVLNFDGECSTLLI